MSTIQVRVCAISCKLHDTVLCCLRLAAASKALTLKVAVIRFAWLAVLQHQSASDLLLSWLYGRAMYIADNLPCRVATHGHSPDAV